MFSIGSSLILYRLLKGVSFASDDPPSSGLGKVGCVCVVFFFGGGGGD